MRKFLLAVVLGSLICSSQVLAAEYSIDQSHTTLGFSVAHLVITKTKGEFTDYTGSVNFDPSNLDDFSAEVTIQTASIDTKNKKRDDHLRSPDFFDAPSFPTIVFKGNSIAQKGEGYVISGDLTMKGQTKPVELGAIISGPVTNPFGGGQVLGLEAKGMIDRKDWGVTWNKSMDNGGVVVGEEVELLINIELHGK